MKITAEHLARGAYVYVRQSTADQLVNNPESRRRQYGLAERARSLGWKDAIVIDEDLGSSGSGISRPGFEAGTGIRSSSFAALSERSSSMRTASTNRVIPTTGCCSA
ncbi:recombinase family protein [Mesorhizobium sp. M0217]|uniref:recombinase family protein n=1 Tax=unclassified Mesorhizobium TaxID=325217 RepID=UPI0033354771